jgi:hypothetical protein
MTQMYVRPLQELWELWKPRVRMKAYPFTYAVYDEVERVMTGLTSCTFQTIMDWIYERVG